MITKQHRIEPTNHGPVMIKGQRPYAMIARHLAQPLVCGSPDVHAIFTSDDVDFVAVRYYDGDHESALYWLQAAIDMAVLMTRNGVVLDQ
jgi:hypothetical protein